MPRKVAQYGSLASPITPEMVVAEGITLGQVALDGEDVYWVEQRPAEAGRNVIVRRSADGATADVTPPPFNARTRVHEYGGGAFTVHEGTVYFSNFRDQRLHVQKAGGAPEALTPAGDVRYADLVVDAPRRRLLCIKEDYETGGEADNSIAAIDLTTGAARTLVSGHDFFGAPRLSPDGATLAWLSWDHPNMPWDGTDLWSADVRPDGTLGDPTHIAGGRQESVLQPEWSPDGVLYFVSDRTGWWNLYRWRAGRIEPVLQMQAEFTAPAWVLGNRHYGFASASRIICSYVRGGLWYIGDIDTGTLQFKAIPTPFTEITRSGINVAPGRVVFGAGAPTMPATLLLHDLNAGSNTVLRQSASIQVDPGYLSAPENIEFPTEAGLAAHAFYYPPRSTDFTAPAGERPPLIVISHGGPTSAAGTALDLRIQFWTSRGFAVADVNYGGSTGYGTEYRRRLRGTWGIVDVDDCVNAARHLVRRGLADPERLIIRGGSAGGYTTLAGLAFRDTFRAGACFYGIGDLEILAKETHKFESRYLDSLIGPYPARRDLYLQRSPIHHLGGFSCPVILFHGLEDQVVPPNQSEMVYQALKAKGIVTEYIAYPGEQHGFRKAETIKDSLQRELAFYSGVFGFSLPAAG